MRPQTSLLSLAAMAGLATAFPTSTPADRPAEDGVYHVSTNADGSLKFTKKADINISSATSRSVSSSRISEAPRGKRFNDCWGTALDHAYVDAAVQGLKDWVTATTGNREVSSGDSPDSVAAYAGDVQVYCINAPHMSGNLDLVDVNYALEQMDALCPRYTASYYQWPNSVEIIGKALAVTPVCQG